MYYNINKRSWKLIVGLLSFTFLIYFLQSTPFSFGDLSTRYDEFSSDNELQQPQENKMAFVTFLCDDIMGEATEVLVYSLKKTETKHDIVVLVLDDVTQIVRNRLEYLGAQVINVDQIKYPWDSSSARKKGFNKACRYSKLNLWNLTQYKKVVFLDADTMVVNPIDELFDYPQLTAAVDIGGVLNTGVFVAEPNADTYKNMMNTYENAPSYNRGDQGFINYYFNQSAHPLPGNYNLMIKFTHFSALASSFIAKNTVKVLHFTSETKPWNFHFLHHAEWRENYDGNLFGVWTRALRQMRTQLSIGGLYNNDDMDTWRNKNRVKQVCDVQLKKNYGRKYPITEKFTVIINTSYKPININYLHHLLRMYSSSKKVDRIYIHGNSVKNENGHKVILNASYLRRLHLRKPIKVIPQGQFKSVNNRFNPIQGTISSAVFMTDINVFTSMEDLEFGFDVWKKNQDSVVGFKANSHSSDMNNKLEFIENVDKKTDQFSMIESKSMFIRSDYLYAYTCLIPEEIHYYIDQHPTCYDIAINMLVSGMTGASPVLVDATHLVEFQQGGTQKSITRQSQCLNDLSILFDGNTTLNFNNEIITRISSTDTSELIPWNTWSDYIIKRSLPSIDV